jgi:hypothetical protein
VGKTLTWAAGEDYGFAYATGNENYFGDPSNRAAMHGSWELCFA